MQSSDIKKYTFSGHDSFQCRLLWLKKGYDFLNKGHSFNDADAPVLLGVGNNMVRSIRHWLRSFGLLQDDQELPNTLADLIFSDDNGFDPFLEDQATLWLLHYQLTKTHFASTYWIIFNELRKRKVEFTREDYVLYVTLKAQQEKFSVNPSTVGDDFVVFTKMYLQAGKHVKDKDDTVAGILTELSLLRTIDRKSDDGKTTSPIHTIPLGDREDLPAVLILICILETPGLGLSVSLETLENDSDMPCAIFAMNRAGLLRKIEELIIRFPKMLVYSDQAGVRELQFREKPIRATQLLKEIYATAEV